MRLCTTTHHISIYVTRLYLNSVFMMKLSVRFFLLALTFFAAKSKDQVNSETVCVETKDALKLLYGREGRAGLPGPKGFIGLKGNAGPFGEKGFVGRVGLVGEAGDVGSPGETGDRGAKGARGEPGELLESGLWGEDGEPGHFGDLGKRGDKGAKGLKGRKGLPGYPGAEIEEDMEKYILNGYSVAQSGYYNNWYHVTARQLTDGQTDTGGWGSETSRIGNYIQATYIRPVYVTSVTVAGGFIPTWRRYIRPKYGRMDLQYSLDGITWLKTVTIQSPVASRTILYRLPNPVTAQYWRLIAVEKKWVGTTEFALKPLLKP